MNKASKALRRSSIRLKSISSGHRELNLVISELRDVRLRAETVAVSQHTASQDVLKWSLCERSLAIKDTFTQLSELDTLWVQAQKDFTDGLKNFIFQFEMILEDENHLDQARNRVSACEMREAKIKKELGKVVKSGASKEAQQLKMKLAEAETSRNQAQFEVLEQIQETEMRKLIRIKEGLLKLSNSYLRLAHNCQIVYQSYGHIAVQLPEAHGKLLHDVRYKGPTSAKEAVSSAKDAVLLHNPPRQNIDETLSSLTCQSPPPSYFAAINDATHVLTYDDFVNAECQTDPVPCFNPLSSFQSVPNSSDSSRESFEFSPQRSNPFENDTDATSRRSIIHLKSSSGHRELNLVISELRDARSKVKAAAVCQNTASQDMLKWSLCEENQAIQDTLSQISELDRLWAKAQREFADGLKNFIYQFEMILEDENHLDQARNRVSACEMREAKIKKELGKVIKSGASKEAQQLKMKLAEAEASRNQAQFEVLNLTEETEVMKLIRIKEGLLKLSDSYLLLARKCQIVYQAYHDVAVQLPEAHAKDIHELRYAGPAVAKQAVLRAKDQVQQCDPQNISTYAPKNGPPPSCSTEGLNKPENMCLHVQDSVSIFRLIDKECQTPAPCSNPFMWRFQCMPYSIDTSREGSDFSPQRSNPFENDADATSHSISFSNINSSGHGINQDTDHTDHEDSLAEAVARMKT